MTLWTLAIKVTWTSSF